MSTEQLPNVIIGQKKKKSKLSSFSKNTNEKIVKSYTGISENKNMIFFAGNAFKIRVKY